MQKRDLIIILSALLMAAVMGIFVITSGAIETGSWGLSFPSEGSAPHGPATVQQLKKYDAVYLGIPMKKSFI